MKLTFFILKTKRSDSKEVFLAGLSSLNNVCFGRADDEPVDASIPK